MSDNNTPMEQKTLTPSADLKAFDRLIGTWALSGETEGHIRFEWMAGGFFLLQHVDMVHAGHVVKGLEVIGHERPFGETEPGEDIKSRFYDSEGNTLDYVYEFDGETLTIWGGQKGSPSFYKGTLSADGNTLSGGWQWPGGGYGSTGTRVK
jgi:hypothetical protein